MCLFSPVRIFVTYLSQRLLSAYRGHPEKTISPVRSPKNARPCGGGRRFSGMIRFLLNKKEALRPSAGKRPLCLSCAASPPLGSQIAALLHIHVEGSIQMSLNRNVGI